MNYDLTVAYRIYPKISKVPLFYPDNKFKLSELGIKSLKLGLGKLNAKIYVLLDNCPAEYKKLFLKYFDERDLKFIEYQGVGNLNTFQEQINILLGQNESEYIYFAEDDYLYLPNCFEIGISAIQQKGVDFISLYDHLDNYQLNFQNINSKIKLLGNHHFRTNSSTCLTFLTTKTILKQTKKIFLTYSKGNYDYCLWIALTKYNIFKFWYKTNFLLLLRAYFYGGLWILFGKKYKLYTPHLESTGISPTIDWSSYFNKINLK